MDLVEFGHKEQDEDIYLWQIIINNGFIFIISSRVSVRLKQTAHDCTFLCVGSIKCHAVRPLFLSTLSEAAFELTVMTVVSFRFY